MKNIFFTTSSYIGGLLKAGRMAIHTKDKEMYFGLTDRDTVELLHSGKDSGWIAPPLTNGWEIYDESIAYRKDATGQLHFKGTARYGALNYAIFQLPLEFRPGRNISIVILMRDGFGRLDINTQGYVIPRGSEELAYDDSGEPTGEIIEVGYVSLESGVML